MLVVQGVLSTALAKRNEIAPKNDKIQPVQVNTSSLLLNTLSRRGIYI